MRRFGRVLGRVLVFLLLIFAVASFVFPRDQVSAKISLDDSALGDDLVAYLEQSELAFSDIVPGARKQIVWAGAPGVKTPLAVVYLHGFSATAAEVRPVPDKVAAGLGANLFFTRLAGHGRGGAALAEAHANDWIADLSEALAIGRRLGDRVLILSTSTGATLASFAATDAEAAKGLAGVVMISPNFGLRAASAKILALPLARWWGPLVAGAERQFTPQNAAHAAGWTHRYPTVALFPMAALVRAARDLPFAEARVPALFLFSPDDQVIDPNAAAQVARAWGGPVTVERRQMGPGDDTYSHVIAGDALSPGQTEDTVRIIQSWAQGL